MVFGNPGTTELPLMDAFAVENEIKYVLGLQEAALMAMADGYAQASGKLAVLNFHVAPGLRQCHGHALRRPDGVVADLPHRRPAGCRVSRHRADPVRGPADPGAAVRQMGRRGAAARRPAAPGAPRRQDRIGAADGTGVPLAARRHPQVRGRDRPGWHRPGSPCACAATPPRSPRRAAILARGASAPSSWRATRVAQSHAHAELVDARRAHRGAWSMPSSFRTPRRFLYPIRCSAGNVTRLQPAVRKMLDEYDVLVSAGADLFTLSLPSNVDPMPPGMALIHLDTDPWEIGKNYPANAAILGDPKSTLPELSAKTRERMTSGGARRRPRPPADRERSLARRSRSPQGQGPPLAKTRRRRVAARAPPNAIGEMLPKDAVVIEEVLLSAPGIRQPHHQRRPAELLWLARRRHRLGPAGRDRGGSSRCPNGRWSPLDRRRQCHVHRAGAMDGRALPHPGGVRDPQQHLLPHPQAAPAPLRGHAEQVDTYRGHGATRPRDRLRRPWSRLLGVAAERAKTVHEATDPIGKALKDNVANADRRRARPRVQADVRGG